MEFDGLSSYIEIDNQTDLDIGTFTYTVWFNANDVSGTQILLNKWDEGGSAGNGPIFRLSGTELYFTSRRDDGTLIDFTTSGAGITADTWHYAVVTHNSTTVQMYLDGVAQTPTASANGTVQTNDRKMRIGGVRSSQTFNGTIDEVRIYNRSLGASEILEEYNKGMGAYFWSFTGVLNGSQVWIAQVSDSYINSSQPSAFNLNLIFNPDDCSDATNEIRIITLNITNEKDLDAFIHGTILTAITITRNGTDYDFSIQNNGSSTGLDICVDAVWLGASLDADITYHDEPNFETSNWYIRSFTIVDTTVTPTNISLLNSSDVTSATFFVIDGSGSVAPFHIIRAQRFNFDTNSWEIMRMARTSYNGYTILPLEALDSFYQFVVTDDSGTILKEFEQTVITETENQLNLNPTFRGYYPEVVGTVGSICTYNSGTAVLTCSVSDSSGLVGGANLQVYRYGALNWTKFCHDGDVGATTTLTCTLNNNDFFWYVVNAHFEDNLTVNSGSVGNLSQENLYGRTGFIAGAFLTITTGMIGVFAGEVAIVFMIVGFTMASVLGLIELTNPTTIMLMVILGVVVIWRVRK
jgi:hypothetical protein